MFAVRDATKQVGGQVVQVFGLAGVDVATDVEVVVVGLAGDFGQRHHAGISGTGPRHIEAAVTPAG